jgi:hypothetical protein
MLVPVPSAFPVTPATAADVQLITAPDVVLLNAILVDAGLNRLLVHCSLPLTVELGLQLLMFELVYYYNHLKLQ